VPKFTFRVSALALAVFSLGGFNTQALAASVDTWTGGGASTDWVTATNWAYSTGTGPVASGDSLVFTNTNIQGTATLTDSLTSAAFLLAGITFNAPAISYTTTGNAFELTGSILDSSTNTETIDNAISEPATETLTVASGGDLVLAGPITGAGGITLNGPGTVTLASLNGFTGRTTVNDGTLTLNYTAGGAPTTNMISASSPLTLGGGTLTITGASASNTQAFAGTTLSGGTSVVNATGSATVALGAITYGVGSILQLNGPAYNNSVTTTAGQAGTGLVAGVGTITTTSGAANTVLNSAVGGNADYITYATVGLYDWAIASGSTPFSLIGASQGTGGTAGDGAYVIDNGGALPAGGLIDIIGTATNRTTLSVGALRFNVPGAALAVTYITDVEGMLVTPNVGANNVPISTAGDLQPGERSSTNAGSFSIVQNDTLGMMVFSGAISDGKKAGSSIVQSGPGTVNYGTVANGYSGSTYLDGGVTDIQVDGGLGNAATGATTFVNGGTIFGAATFTLDNGAGANARPISLGVDGGGLAELAGDTMTVDGNISGNGGLIVGIPASSANQNVLGQVPGSGAGTANAQQLATGTVVLTYPNGYFGGTTLDTGTLNINGIYALGGADYGGVTFNGGTLQYATAFTGNGSGDLTSIGTAGVTLASGGGTIDTNGNAVTYAGSIGNGGSGALTVETSQTGGSLTLNGNNTFTGGVTLLSGKLTFGGSNVYTGPTAVTAGTLTLKTGSSLGNTVITVSSAATMVAALTGNGNINLGTTGATLTLSGGSSLILQAIDSDTLDTLTLNSTIAAGTGTVLTVGGASSAAGLYFDIGSAGSNELVVNNGVTAFGADGGKIFITDLDTNTPASSYTLVSDPNGGLVAGGITPGADFWLGTTGLTLGGQSYALSLTSSGTTLVLNLTLNTPNYYWTGGTSSWGTLSNFATSATGSAQTTPLSATSNVFLTANSATNFSQTLDGNYTINSLNFTGAGTSAASNSITLADGTGSALTINAANGFVDSSLNSYPAGTGLVVQPGSAAQTISANIDLGNSQTWLVNNSPATPLTVSGVIADSLAGSGDTLTKSGTGALILTNAETYDGGTVVNAGTLQLGSGGSLLATGALTVSGTGTFDLNGNSQAVGGLSDGSVSTGIITSSTGTAVLTLNNSSASTFSGTITDAGTATNGVSLALTLNGPGNVTLSGSNSYNGLTTLNAGNLTVANNYALGNPTAANGGLTIANAAGTSNVYFTSLNPTIASLNSSTSVGTNIVLGNTVGSGTSTTLNVGGAGGISTFTGTISDLTGTKAPAIGNLNVFGGGLLILTAANTFTGVTTVTGSNASFASELELQNAGALQDSTLYYNNQGGVINFSTLGAVTFSALTGAQNLALTNQSGTAVTLTIGNSSGVNDTYTGNLGGLGGLIKNGSNTLTLGSLGVGGASYGGTTTVNQGILVIGGTSSLTGTIVLTGANGTDGITFDDDAVVNTPGILIVDSAGGAAYPGAATLLVTGTASVTVGGFQEGNTTRVGGGNSETVSGLGSFTVNGAYDLYQSEGSTVGNNTVNLNGGTLAVQDFTYPGGGGAGSVTTLIFNGGTLKALASDPTGSSFLPLFTTLTADVSTGGAFVNTNGFNITVAQPLLHSGTGTDGGLTVLDSAGGGSLTLLGAETYTGPTTINSRATLQLGNGLTGGDGTITTSSGITDNGTLIYNRFGALSSSLVISGTGNVQVSGPGSETLLAVNSYTGSTTINSGATLQLGNGATGNDGTIATSSGITDNGTLIYDRFGALSSSVVISGAGNVQVSGPGSQALLAINTYTGSTTINSGGTLQLGNGTTGNDGTITTSSGITDNGTLIYDRFGALSSSLAIGGAGGVTKLGPGSQILTANSGYTGSTVVSAGSLIVSGSLSGSSSATVNPTGNLEVDGLFNNAATIQVTGGELSGNGSVGAVSVTTAGTLAPGLSTQNSADSGTLTASGAVSLDSTSFFSIRLGASSSDQLALAPGDLLSLNGATLKLNLDGDFVQQAIGFIYILINGGTATTGDISGQFAQGGQITASNGYVFNILYNVDANGNAAAGDDVDLQLTAVPEPGTWAMMLSGMGMLCVWQRSRRRRRSDA